SMHRGDLLPRLLDAAAHRGELLLRVAQLRTAEAGRLRRRLTATRRLRGRRIRRLAHLEVLVDAAGEVPEMPAEHRVLLIGDALEQVPVVADHEQGAGE